MKALTPSELALHVTTPWSEDTLARSEVIAAGRNTGQIVTGEVLEAALQWKDYTLLFVTDGIPSEDSLRIYLFDARWKLVDSATLGGMYTTGAFSGLELAPPNGVRFQFIGGITWELALFDEEVVSLPFTDPTGVSRPFAFKKRFKLHGSPLPDRRN